MPPRELAPALDRGPGRRGPSAHVLAPFIRVGTPGRIRQELTRESVNLGGEEAMETHVGPVEGPKLGIGTHQFIEPLGFGLADGSVAPGREQSVALVLGKWWFHH
jgi:hypothetical protein